MQSIVDSAEAQFAAEAVREASLLGAARAARDGRRPDTKDDLSPVTVADFAAQAVVAQRLAERFPDAVLIGEEDAARSAAPDGRETLEQIARFVGRSMPGVTPEAVCDWIDRGAGQPPATFWTLDPVDGTKGFLRNDQYAVALALVDAAR